MIKVTKTGDWAKAQHALNQQARRRAIHGAIHEQLVYMKDAVGNAFDTAGQSNGRPWPATAAGGKAFEGSEIKSYIRINHPPGAATGYIYFPHSTRFRHRKGSAIRALVAHEFGAVYSVRVTAKLLAAIHANRNASGGATRSSGQTLKVGGAMVIKTPRRSFLVDTIAAHGGQRAIDRLIRDLKQRLPNWGRV